MLVDEGAPQRYLAIPPPPLSQPPPTPPPRTDFTSPHHASPATPTPTPPTASTLPSANALLASITGLKLPRPPGSVTRAVGSPTNPSRGGGGGDGEDGGWGADAPAGAAVACPPPASALPPSSAAASAAWLRMRMRTPSSEPAAGVFTGRWQGEERCEKWLLHADTSCRTEHRRAWHRHAYSAGGICSPACVLLPALARTRAEERDRREQRAARKVALPRGALVGRCQPLQSRGAVGSGAWVGRRRRRH